jgi:hypothetical protein
LPRQVKHATLRWQALAPGASMTMVIWPHYQYQWC